MEKRRGIFTFESSANLDFIQKSVQQNEPEMIQQWQFSGLQNLIGFIEVGIYPQLNARRADVEAKVAEYIAALKQA